MESFVINLEDISKTGIIIGILTFLIGVKYPDWDFKLRLKHRSAFTHSPFILFLLYAVYQNGGGEEYRYFLISFSMAVVIHLAYDYFPQRWVGGALVYFPFGMSMGEGFSKVFFLSSIFFSNFIAVKLMQTSSEYLVFLIIGLLIFFKEAKKEKRLFRPLTLYLLVYFGTGYFKYDELFNWAAEPLAEAIKLWLKVNN